MRKLLFILLGLIIYASCATEPIDHSIPFTDQAIFQDAIYIKVPLFTYTDRYTNRSYTFHGTSGDQIHNDEDFYNHTTVIPYDFFDIVSNRPSFIWEKTQSKYVMVAVFNERVAINNEKNQIANKHSIVWAWNTGMSTGQEGAIGYHDGCNVIDDEIQYGITPEPLEYGHTYMLAIWAWNQKANEVKYSSREIPFVVEEPEK